MCNASYAGPEAASVERCGRRALFGGCGGPPPENIWNLDGKSCTLGDSLYKIIHRDFFSPVLDVPHGPTFWEVGTALAVPAVPVVPALLWGLRRQNFTSRDEPVHIICTLGMIDTGLYATQPWAQLSCGHFALFASVTF